MKRKDAPDIKELKKRYTYDPISGLFFHRTAKGGKRIGDWAGTILKSGRIQICVNNERYHAHRLAWYYTYGSWPIEIDHKDGDPSNNALSNLRVATRSQNLMNGNGWAAKPSGLPRGISRLPSGNYIARLGVKYKTIHLGCFNSIKEAEAAYKKAARKYFGEFAK